MSLLGRMLGVVAGCGLAVVVGTLGTLGTVGLSGTDARAAGPAGLRVVSIDVTGRSSVALNEEITIRFNAPVTGASLTNGAISIFARDEAGEPIGDARPGRFRRKGNTVRFVPTLPTHARNPSDPTLDFFAPGTPQDDAFENGSFRAATDYLLIVAGGRARPPARSASVGALRRTATADFTTTDGVVAPLFLEEATVDSPPPLVRFTNPLDRVSSAIDGYVRPGGTPDVAIGTDVTVFLTGLPLDPATVRAPGAVQLTLVERLGALETPTDVPGDALIEQDRNRSILVFRPREPLEPHCTYALRIDRDVKDIRGQFELAHHAERLRLRSIHDFLTAVRRFDPDLPIELLPDPLASDIFDWPSQVEFERRGEIKRNVFALGNTRPWEIDPRVFAVFTTGAADTPTLTTPTFAEPRGGSLARVTRIDTPLGLQGAAGAGSAVVIPFALAQRRSRPAFIQAEYGIDLNADGAIDESEYLPATLDIRDGRHSGETQKIRSRRKKTVHQYETAPDTGRSNALVWNSTLDVRRSIFTSRLTVYTPQGRTVPDPNNPGRVLRLDGPGGAVFRVRTRRGARRASDWAVTGRFDLSAASTPDLTLDDVTSGAPTLIAWTAIHPDSEDFNDNDVLDPLIGEDMNGNGVLDEVPIAAAFDYYVLGVDEDPQELDAIELATLDWQPCTRSSDVGDADVDVTSSANGIANIFAWDVATDAPGDGAQVIFRARAFDGVQTGGRWVYRTDPVTIVD